jgi:hypothetical protein
MDFEAGKLLETDVLLNAPIELARLVEVAAPSLEMVHALIDLMTVNAAPQHRQYLDTAPDKRLAVCVGGPVAGGGGRHHVAVALRHQVEGELPVVAGALVDAVGCALVAGE